MEEKDRNSNNRTKPDFSGTWIFNKTKSCIQSPVPDSSTFIIKHDEPNFTLERIHVINGVRDSFTITLTTDGKATTTVTKQRDIEVTARMYREEECLVFDSHFRHGSETATNIVKYSLSENGLVLTAEEEFKSREHNHYNRWVFDRAENHQAF